MLKTLFFFAALHMRNSAELRDVELGNLLAAGLMLSTINEIGKIQNV